jgi:hypothetical protein
MLTVEIKLNGQTIAEARLVPCGGVVNAGTQVSDDYDVQWVEEQGEGLEATRDAGGFIIRHHRRGATVWALVAKAAAAILDQKVERMEGRE